MTTIIVLFNLKTDADRQAYEAWAKDTDLPTVRNLPSIDGFRVFKTSAMLGNDDKPPYEYVEVIDVNNMDTFSQDVGTQTMQQVAAEFQSFADNPMFILSDNLE